MTSAVELTPAAARLLRQVADHDKGAGVQFEPMPHMRRRHPGTRAVFARTTFLPLISSRLLTHADGDDFRVRITGAGQHWLYRYEPGRIPGDAELLFIKASRTGTVHITVKERPDYDDRGEILTFGAGQGALATLLSAPTITLCGIRTFPHNPSPDARHYGVSHFPDDQLCGGCHRALHPLDQPRAFEHPTAPPPTEPPSELPTRALMTYIP